MVALEGYRQGFNETFGNWCWRLNNLYWITDKEGRRTKFRMNWAQEALFNDMHYLNVILKARQLGFTTFIQIFMLDQCLFNSNIRAGTIAHRLDDAQTYRHAHGWAPAATRWRGNHGRRPQGRGGTRCGKPPSLRASHRRGGLGGAWHGSAQW